MPRRSIAEMLTGAAVLIVAAGFLVYAIAHSGRSTAAGYTLDAKFDHIDGLAVGSDVRIAGVKVGSITATRIDPQSFQAVVSLSVRDDLKLPKDTSAEITSESLLGGKYLALVPGGDEASLKPGQTITITQGSISLEQLLGKFIFSVTSMKPAGSDSGGGSPAGTAPNTATNAPTGSLSGAPK